MRRVFGSCGDYRCDAVESAEPPDLLEVSSIFLTTSGIRSGCSDRKEHKTDRDQSAFHSSLQPQLHSRTRQTGSVLSQNKVAVSRRTCKQGGRRALMSS